jgi:hypothetical protein
LLDIAAGLSFDPSRTISDRPLWPLIVLGRGRWRISPVDGPTFPLSIHYLLDPLIAKPRRQLSGAWRLGPRPFWLDTPKRCRLAELGLKGEKARDAVGSSKMAFIVSGIEPSVKIIA